MSGKKLNIAVLISGAGSTLQNLIDSSRTGELPVEIKLVVSSRPGAGGLQRACAAGIPIQIIQRSTHSEALFSRQINEAVRSAGVELVCMAGFMNLWMIPPDFEGKVMNIHPALLPSFGGQGCYGLRVHQSVLDAGCKITGCTAHFADNIYDHGPIILQKEVSVREDDTAETLALRVQEQERILYPQAIRLFAEGRLHIEGRRVRIRM